MVVWGVFNWLLGIWFFNWLCMIVICCWMDLISCLLIVLVFRIFSVIVIVCGFGVDCVLVRGGLGGFGGRVNLMFSMMLLLFIGMLFMCFGVK